MIGSPSIFVLEVLTAHAPAMVSDSLYSYEVFDRYKN